MSVMRTSIVYVYVDVRVLISLTTRKYLFIYNSSATILEVATYLHYSTVFYEFQFYLVL